MKILAVVFPGFTAIGLLGPANAWGLMPGVEFQTAWKTAGPVTVDMGLQLVATHSFADCWRVPDVLFVPGGGMGVCEALQDDELLDTIAAIGTRAG
jgi:cyclohexyl-isocyanide hydratase